MKIVFLPIDNRPVCYQMPEMIGEIYKNCEIVLPDREFLGGLDKIADISMQKSHIVFIIGGSLGLWDKVKSRSDFKMSFGKITLPHQLMRVVLCE